MFLNCFIFYQIAKICMRKVVMHSVRTDKSIENNLSGHLPIYWPFGPWCRQAVTLRFNYQTVMLSGSTWVIIPVKCVSVRVLTIYWKLAGFNPSWTSLRLHIEVYVYLRHCCIYSHGWCHAILLMLFFIILAKLVSELYIMTHNHVIVPLIVYAKLLRQNFQNQTWYLFAKSLDFIEVRLF